jgi:hypothetical protein
MLFIDKRRIMFFVNKSCFSQTQPQTVWNEVSLTFKGKIMFCKQLYPSNKTFQHKILAPCLISWRVWLWKACTL